MSISLAINVKNGEKTLAKTIESAIEISDEIIVVDNNSNDLTSKIAKKYTKHVYISKTNGDFSRIRNITIKKAQSDWILILDADEVLSIELTKKIPSLLIDSGIDGYWFRRRNYISKKKYLRYGLFYPDYQLRLFRNHKGYKFIGKVHAQMTIPQFRTREINFDIMHFQSPSKLISFSNYKLLYPYIYNEAREHYFSTDSAFKLFYNMIGQIIVMFFGGLIRGKGILDGVPGITAHCIFTSSVSIAFLIAIYNRIILNFNTKHRI